MPRPLNKHPPPPDFLRRQQQQENGISFAKKRPKQSIQDRLLGKKPKPAARKYQVGDIILMPTHFYFSGSAMTIGQILANTPSWQNPRRFEWPMEDALAEIVEIDEENNGSGPQDFSIVIRRVGCQEDDEISARFWVDPKHIPGLFVPTALLEEFTPVAVPETRNGQDTTALLLEQQDELEFQIFSRKLSCLYYLGPTKTGLHTLATQPDASCVHRADYRADEIQALLAPDCSESTNNESLLSNQPTISTPTPPTMTTVVEKTGELKEVNTMINIEEAKTHLGKKFRHADDVATLLSLALNLNQNVMMYGPGGHGKSEMTEEFLKWAGLEAYTMACGEGLSEEKLFGGVDMKKLTDEGKVEYLFENSFMNHEIVVFEELFDAPTSVLLSLKDILTSKRFRQGNQVHEIKTKTVIVCTNRTRQEVGEDASSLALLERFPLELEVKWPSYSFKDYGLMFNTVLGSETCQKHGTELKMLSSMCAKTGENNDTPISPRTAMHAARTLVKAGFDALRFIAGLPLGDYKELLAKAEREQKIEKQKTDLESIKTRLHDIVKAAKSIKVDDTADAIKLTSQLKTINAEMAQIAAFDDNLPLRNEIMEQATKVRQEVFDIIG